MNPVAYLQSRMTQLEPRTFFPDGDMTCVNDPFFNGTVMERSRPHVLSERMVYLGECDKVFASHWLTEELVILGTKSNELLLVDLTNDQIFHIPLLVNINSRKCQDTTGIHCIECSKYGGYLTTGGVNPNELAVYKLPELTPYCICQGHGDWIFDVAWLNESTLVSGSRDSSMALWKINSTTVPDNYQVPFGDEWTHGEYPLAEYVPGISKDRDFSVTSSSHRVGATKVRSLAYNDDQEVLASLHAGTCYSSVHFWDSCTLIEICSLEMPYFAENVCLELQQKYNLYAVGSRSHVSFIDGRLTNQTVGSIQSRDRDCGVRSLQFKDDMVSIGTGGGNIYFYDLRAARYLSTDGTTTYRENLHCLKTSNGWVRKDTTYRDMFSSLPYHSNAVYTHLYSPSLSKMLVAGGPLPLGLYGNYLSIWS